MNKLYLHHLYKLVHYNQPFRKSNIAAQSIAPHFFHPLQSACRIASTTLLLFEPKYFAHPLQVLLVDGHGSF